jgi:hypothetical protein
MTTKKVSTAVIAAKLPLPPLANGEALATATSQLLTVVMACPDYANQPVVQAIVKTLQTDNTALSALVGEVASAKAAVSPLEAKRNAAIAVVRRDRHNLAGTLTAICAGNAASITAWGATPSPSSATPASTAAPAGLSVTPLASSPGTLRCKCSVVSGAASYLWSLTTDPTVAPGSVLPTLSTGSRVEIPGQTVGHVVYVRVAVLRHRSGMSAWSDAVQYTVR